MFISSLKCYGWKVIVTLNVMPGKSISKIITSSMTAKLTHFNTFLTNLQILTYFIERGVIMILTAGKKVVNRANSKCTFICR